MALKVSIDTCVLLDLLFDENSESINRIQKCHEDHEELVISGVVYGELCPAFIKDGKDIDLFLSDMDIMVSFCNVSDYRYAGEKWNEYIRRRRFICPACGGTIELNCDKCGEEIKFRQHILSDFLIGAFSENQCDGLLTRDYGYYRTYFPGLRLF